MGITRYRYLRKKKYQYGDEIDWNDQQAIENSLSENVYAGMSAETKNQGAEPNKKKNGLAASDVGGTLGNLLGPLGGVAGTLVGGLVDTIIGPSEEEIRAKNIATVAEQRQQDAEGRARYINYNRGSNQNVIARYGGKIKTMTNGGNLQQLSSDSVLVNGPSHEEGGVSLSPTVEVEGNETVNRNFVFSEELGFAARHKPIARSIGKIERKPNSFIKTNSLALLRAKEEMLKVEQEALKEALGIEPISRPS